MPHSVFWRRSLPKLVLISLRGTLWKLVRVAARYWLSDLRFHNVAIASLGCLGSP